MSTYRIYIDSREREDKTNTTDTDFVFALPTPINITTQSLANVDVVCIPNSIRTVTAGVNDSIFIFETSSFNNGAHRQSLIEPGYYSSGFGFAAAIQATLNGPFKYVFADYTVVYDPIKNRFEISNPMQITGESFTIYTEASFPDHPSWVGRAYTGAFRQCGLVSGHELQAGHDGGIYSVTTPNAPQLQFNTQLFLKSDFGIPGTSVGPKGAQHIIRRIVLDAQPLSLVVDRHSTAFDAISIPPGTISSLRFTLCGFDGKVIDLNGLSWSFSITIFKE